VLDDPDADPAAVRRLLLCSGKVAIDLLDHSSDNRSALAIVRIEQLYPFPTAEVEQILARYSSAQEVVWVQEEPANMGAWDFVYPHLHDLLEHRLPLRYVGRPDRSSPAEGSSAWHAVNQKTLIEEAFAVV
jgi:2-oxoglutarate dehydrogenase E1 component